MATLAEKKKAIEEWKEHCKQIAALTDTSLMAPEGKSEKEARIHRLQQNYAAFCEYYFPHFLQLKDKTTGKVIRTIHNAPFHNQAASKVKRTANLKAVFMWPRGHAKSTHMDVFTPLWLMFQPLRLINFMVVVGKSEDAASLVISRQNWSTTIASSVTSENRSLPEETGPTENSRRTAVSSSWHAVAVRVPEVSVIGKPALITSSSMTLMTMNSARTKNEFVNLHPG